ncbi:MAG: hypothetical protein KDD70_17170 [Bdellovibrionales bacterium]|nr:hypothetical protein [Bdellovibrionales bacterium]
MKRRIQALSVLLWVCALFLPTALFAHEGEDHGEDYHIDVMHIMENGFHGKQDGKVVEVVLAPDVSIEKEGKAITFKDITVGDTVLVKGAKMPGDKIGATKITVDSKSAGPDSMKEGHAMGHEHMEGHKEMHADHMEHDMKHEGMKH